MGNAQQTSRVEAERMLTMGHWRWDFSAQRTEGVNRRQSIPNAMKKK
jgi:hypothetical protein